ncbi:hypothetical protein R75461_07889 [Paraburkholderia nemoris]|uniref:hypothetical protein n=1 Tax=Paraburkholderia nemoris TaxID=2793076 RepID=UPI00190CB1EF|nr:MULTISPECIES: hypothetical protein [Paraburkholderia]MBK3786921.1 hypothetical protein [Paraburkholderia aspalathi]CAE6859105.1 hypothetical protein R75461_07889 [Paraburkholderia nemoris]
MRPPILSRLLPYILGMLLSAFSVVYLHAAEQRSAARTCVNAASASGRYRATACLPDGRAGDMRLVAQVWATRTGELLAERPFSAAVLVRPPAGETSRLTLTWL